MKHTTWFSLVFLATLSCLIPLSVKAQVTPDGTTSTTVNQDGNNFTIEQGDRVGDNLFHSFNQFSVPTLGSAAFNNAGIDTGSLLFTNNGQLISSTSGQGNAGSVIVNASDTVSFDGRSGILTQVSEEAIGNGGNIEITTNELSLSNGAVLGSGTGGQGIGGEIKLQSNSLSLVNNAEITTFSIGQEPAGNIEIAAGTIELVDNSKINAEAFSQDGGNISLLDSDLITLRRGSQITTEAGTEEAAGNGGDITIDSDLLIAFSDENNDIIANSFEGLGGTIDITADAIFGLEIRDELTPQSDITAFSQTDPSLNGEISINTPDFDPTTGLINLPASVGDASDQISQNPCQRGIGSEFIITGKGGLPPNVNESLNSESAQVGLIETVTSQPQTVGANGIRPNPNNIPPNPSTTTEAVPAQGWVFNDKGEVTLTAYKTTNIGRPSLPKTPINSCSAP